MFLKGCILVGVYLYDIKHKEDNHESEKKNYLFLRASSNSVLRIDSFASAAVWMLVTNVVKSLCRLIIL